MTTDDNAGRELHIHYTVERSKSVGKSDFFKSSGLTPKFVADHVKHFL